MAQSIQLLNKALSINPVAEFWCEQLGMSRSAMATAKFRGRLSPVVAGDLARLLGEDPKAWVALAALEAAPESRTKNKLLTMADGWEELRI